MNLYTVVLLVIESISIAAFAYLAALFIRVYKEFKSDHILVYTIFIVFLLLSQLCSILSATISDNRISATLYVATSSLAIAGFILLLTPLSSNNTHIFIPILVSSPDVLAGLLSTLLILKRIRGETRYFFLFLSLSYYARAIGTLLTAAQGLLLLLLISEAMRATAAVLLALHHTVQVLTHGEKKK